MLISAKRAVCVLYFLCLVKTFDIVFHPEKLSRSPILDSQHGQGTETEKESSAGITGTSHRLLSVIIITTTRKFNIFRARTR